MKRIVLKRKRPDEPVVVEPIAGVPGVVVTHGKEYDAGALYLDRRSARFVAKALLRWLDGSPRAARLREQEARARWAAAWLRRKWTPVSYGAIAESLDDEANRLRRERRKLERRGR